MFESSVVLCSSLTLGRKVPSRNGFESSVVLCSSLTSSSLKSGYFLFESSVVLFTPINFPLLLLILFSKYI